MDFATDDIFKVRKKEIKEEILEQFNNYWCYFTPGNCGNISCFYLYCLLGAQVTTIRRWCTSLFSGNVLKFLKSWNRTALFVTLESWQVIWYSCGIDIFKVIERFNKTVKQLLKSKSKKRCLTIGWVLI